MIYQRYVRLTPHHDNGCLINVFVEIETFVFAAYSVVLLATNIYIIGVFTKKPCNEI